MLKKIRNARNAMKTQKAPHGYYNTFSIANAIGEDGKIKILHIGEFPNHKDGPHSVTKELAQEMVANAKAQILNLLIDFGHESMWNSRAVAAGWIRKESLEVREDGIYADKPEWTPTASRMIANKEILGLSSYYFLEYFDQYAKNRGARLWSLGLTNTPYFETDVDHIPNFANSNLLIGDDEMKFSNDFLKKIGYTDEEIKAGNITDEDVEAKVNAALEKKVEPEKKKPEIKTAPPEPTEKKTENLSVVTASIQKIAETVESLVKKNQNEHVARINSMVDSAIEDRKILPAEKDNWKTLLTVNFDTYSAKLNAIPKNTMRPQPVKVNITGGKNESKPTPKEAFISFANARRVEMEA